MSNVDSICYDRVSVLGTHTKPSRSLVSVVGEQSPSEQAMVCFCLMVFIKLLGSDSGV